MASFRIRNDQEMPSIALVRGKENPQAQKRTVLGAIDNNAENKSDGFTSHDGVVGKKPLGFRRKEDGYQRSKVLQAKQQTTKCIAEVQVTQIVKDFKIFSEVAEDQPARVKNVARLENKSRILKDKPVETARPCSSKEFDFPACLTAIHRTVALPVPAAGGEPMSEGEVIPESPMCLDSSRTDSGFDSQAVLSQLSINENFYACEEYRSDILLYLRALQLEHRPRKNYMLKQPDITNSMRSILVDWLVEVVEEYHMKTETLYLAVSYIDRFLSYMSVVRAKLQLVGTAAMFIASKFEEIYPPDVKDFVFITDDTYSKKQVLRMEHLILKVLSFDLSTPTVLCFLTSFTTNFPTEERVLCLAMYLCELTLLEADPYLAFVPSVIAASALCVARHTLLNGAEVFPEKLQQVVDHHLEELLPCITALDTTFRNAENNPQKAIQEKYKSDKYSKVSSVEPLNEDCHVVLSQRSDR